MSRVKLTQKHKEYMKQWHKDNPDYDKKYRKNNLEKYKKRDRQRYKEKRKYVDNYKLSKGCAICGYNKCARALCFHHKEDKEFGIGSVLSGGMSLRKIKEEMKKCIILCANCHRELEVGKIDEQV